jgi:hypothetical protein
MGNNPFINSAVLVNASSCNFLLLSAFFCFSAESSVICLFNTFFASLMTSLPERGTEGGEEEEEEEAEEGWEADGGGRR